MSEDEKQESQKTVVAFIAGLLIGGLLVWVFGGAPQSEEPTNEAEPSTQSEQTSTTRDNAPAAQDSSTETVAEEVPLPELPVGDADVTVRNQEAGTSVTLAGATFPSDEGWIGVRDYVDGQLTGLLGVARYSKEQGLVPESIVLQRATVPGNTYAIVFYSESGDRAFNLAEDVQVGGVMSTFTAQ